MALLDIHFQGVAGLADQFAQSLAYLVTQDRFAVCRNPDHVIFQIVDGMGSLSITHAGILTEVQRGVENRLPKGKGFNPIYRQ